MREWWSGVVVGSGGREWWSGVVVGSGGEGVVVGESGWAVQLASWVERSEVVGAAFTAVSWLPGGKLASEESEKRREGTLPGCKSRTCLFEEGLLYIFPPHLHSFSIHGQAIVRIQGDVDET